MRAIIQRVLSSSVTVGGETISSINKGLCVLVGITKGDTEKEVEQVVRKVLNMKLWPDEKGRPWQSSVMAMGYEVLFVSQFTLYAQTHKGNRPDFSKALGPEQAKPMYEGLLKLARSSYPKGTVCDGEFGANMLVQIANDGPVTIPLEFQPLKQDGQDATTAKATRTAVAEPALLAAEVAAWFALPSAPKHDNKLGKPSPEQLAAAKAAKEAKTSLISAVSARIAGEQGGSSGGWSAKRVEKEFKQAKRPSGAPTTLAVSDPLPNPASRAAAGVGEGGVDVETAHQADLATMLQVSQQKLAELQARVALLEGQATDSHISRV